MKLTFLLISLFLLISCKHKPTLLTPLQAGWKGQSVCEKLNENKFHVILRCTFPPGVGHEKHQHNSNFGFAISGGKMQLNDDKGLRVVKIKTGSYFNSNGTQWHEALNIGDTTVIYLIVESK